MQDITPEAVVIGVDTHKDVHVAVAINGLGARLGTTSVPVTSQGYKNLRTGPPAMVRYTPSASRARVPTVLA